MKTVLILISFLLFLTGCINTSVSQPEQTTLNKCEKTKDCILVETIEGLDYIPNENDSCSCLCETAINKDSLQLWQEKKDEFKGKLKCDILCKPCATYNKAVCINNVCIPQ